MKYALIDAICPDSIAADLGLNKNDKLLAINGVEIGDILDYYLQTADDYIELLIEQPDGEHVLYEIEKDFNDDLGIIFSPTTIEPIKQCHNNCKFCFIAQMPNDLRKSLYVRDDDYRLSFLTGSYITGTNLSDVEIERIIKFNLSPLYISVHQTDIMRNNILGRQDSFDIMKFLKTLAENGIYFHSQIVLCPGINDGKVLENTLTDLISLIPNLLSIAIVPVGLTKYRKKLWHLNAIDKSTAQQTIAFCDELGNNLCKEYDHRYIYLADELYIKAETDLPSSDYYDDFSQLENGIGMMRLFIDEFDSSIRENRDKIKLIKFVKKYIVLTGSIAKVYLDELLNRIKQINNEFQYEVIAIENKFFGPSINVSGLVVGADISASLKYYPLEKSIVLIPENMLQYDTESFLDDITLPQLEVELKTVIFAVAVNGAALVEKIIEEGVV